MLVAAGDGQDDGRALQGAQRGGVRTSCGVRGAWCLVCVVCVVCGVCGVLVCVLVVCVLVCVVVWFVHIILCALFLGP